MSIHMLLKLLVLILSGARLHGLLKHRLGRTAKYEAAVEHQIDYEEQLDVAPNEARSEPAGARCRSRACRCRKYPFR